MGNNQQDQDVVFTPNPQSAAPTAASAKNNPDVVFTPNPKASDEPPAPATSASNPGHGGEDTDKTWGSVAGIPYKKSSFSVSNIAQNAVRGASDLASGVYEMGKDAFNPYVPLVNGDNSLLNKYVVKPAEQEEQKAKELNADHQPIPAMGHEIASYLPIVGPWAAGLGEQAGTGDVGGAMARGGTQALGSEIVPRVIGTPLRMGANIIGGGARVLHSLGTTGELPGPRPIPAPGAPTFPNSAWLAKTAGYNAASVPGVIPTADWIANHADASAGAMDSGAKTVGKINTPVPLLRDLHDFAGKMGGSTPSEPPSIEGVVRAINNRIPPSERPHRRRCPSRSRLR
jgi:hypothetical protein